MHHHHPRSLNSHAVLCVQKLSPGVTRAWCISRTRRAEPPAARDWTTHRVLATALHAWPRSSPSPHVSHSFSANIILALTAHGPSNSRMQPAQESFIPLFLCLLSLQNGELQSHISLQWTLLRFSLAWGVAGLGTPSEGTAWVAGCKANTPWRANLSAMKTTILVERSGPSDPHAAL